MAVTAFMAETVNLAHAEKMLLVRELGFYISCLSDPIETGWNIVSQKILLLVIQIQSSDRQSRT